MSRFVFTIFFSIFIITTLSGQIIIDWTEIPHDIGTQFTHNGIDSVTVDLGSQGGPQTWNFTSQPTGPQYTDALVVLKASTPFGDSFPTSNLVYMITEDTDTIYTYAEHASTYGCNLGQGFVSPDTVFYRFAPADSHPFPIVYGSSRNYHFGFSIWLAPNMEVRTDSYGFESIDAWGTVVIPYGSFDCLRSCSFDTIVSQLKVNGIPITVDTTTRIVYNFLAENVGLAVHVLSYEGETNPNYTDASFLSRLSDFSSGISESEKTISKSKLLLSPNPFRDKVEIHLTCLAQGAERIDLQIFDVTGRRVREVSLETCNLSLGAQATWDGKDEEGSVLAPGVYFCVMKAGNTHLCQKLIKIQ